MTTASFHPRKPKAWESFLQFLLPHSPNNPTESISKSAMDAVLCLPPLPQLRPPLALYKLRTDFLGVRELSHTVSILPVSTCLVLCFPSFFFFCLFVILHLLSARITGVHHHAGLLNRLISSSKSLRNEFPITVNLNAL